MPRIKEVLPKKLYSFIDLREAKTTNRPRINGEADYYYHVNVIREDGSRTVISLTENDVLELEKRAQRQTEIPPPASLNDLTTALLRRQVRN